MPLTELQQAWVADLRSGKHKQGRGRLHNLQPDTWCCLGRACDVAIAHGVKCERSDWTMTFEVFDRQIHLLPDNVRDALGLADSRGEFDGSSLMELNDDGKTFAEIADVIESEPRGLFNESV